MKANTVDVMLMVRYETEFSAEAIWERGTARFFF